MPGGQHADYLFQQAGLAGVLNHTQHAVQMMASSTAHLHSLERAEALGLNAGDLARTAAIADLHAAARSTSQAVALLRERRASPEHRQLIERLGAVQGNVPDALDRARTRLHLGLHRAEISAADAREISGFWDEMAGRLTGGGLDELYGQIERRLAEFEQQVTVEGGFGQSPHSPLTTWQWILIGVLIGVGAAAVAACLIFSGCSWIAAIFVGLFCLGGTVVNPTIAALCAGFTF